jgi:hypothetical protein
VKASGVLIGGNQRQIDAWRETEDTAARYFEESIPFDEHIVLLTTPNETSQNGGDIQEETQTFRPFFKTSFLAGESGLPKCRAISWRASSEEIERRDDTIFSIISGETSGRIGLGGGVIFHQATIGWSFWKEQRREEVPLISLQPPPESSIKQGVT